MTKQARVSAAVGIGLLFAIGPASAAEIKIMAPRAIQTVLAEAGPQFERATGQRSP